MSVIGAEILCYTIISVSLPKNIDDFDKLEKEMMKIINNVLFLVMGIVLLPFAIGICLCSIPFIVYRRLIDLFKFRTMKDNDIWLVNKRLESLINYLIDLILG